MTFLINYINLFYEIINLFLLEATMFIEISQDLKKLARYFPENLYIVGGYVRNKVLNLASGDVDLASSVEVEEVAERLKNTEFVVKIKNLKFGACDITKGDQTFEYTAFRKEVYDETGAHCPVSVEKTDKLEEDAIRRDFTVNSIYYNINKDEIVDLFHGIVDLKEKIIRCNINPDEILKNDGERILRMIRFAGELDFKIDKKTLLSAKKFVGNIKDISGTRRFNELEKILYCDKRYSKSKKNLKNALNLMNVLSVWQSFGLKSAKIKFKMVYKTEDRLLGLLIDIVDTEKPECLETFLEKFLKTDLGLNSAICKKIFEYLSGYYYALSGMKNKEYFFRNYQNWAFIYPLLGAKSKRVQSKYNFFYQYIIEHGLVIEISDLAINENDIKNNFKNIDRRNYTKILFNLLSKVFDGKIKNQKEDLLKEIERKLQNF